MSTGGFVPYHMRPNKAVDRQLFVELLTKVNRFRPIRSYTYIGFGGSFLEDFKLIHTSFGNRKMISIEEDLNVLNRQKFNVPLRCITRRHQTSGDFVASYSVKGPALIWLDYTKPSELRVQLEEFESLISKLQTHDIVKITLNANPNALIPHDSTGEGGKRDTVEVRNLKRLKKLEARLGDYLPQEITLDMMTVTGLPQVYLQVLEFTSNRGLKGRTDEIFQPLSAFAYTDSAHQMLTVTGIILKKSEVREFLRDTAIKAWRHSSVDWRTIRKISVPELTAREKLFIDQHLPTSGGKQIHKKLAFLFDPDENSSLAILKSYTDFYRYYPSYHRVMF